MEIGNGDEEGRREERERRGEREVCKWWMREKRRESKEMRGRGRRVRGRGGGGLNIGMTKRRGGERRGKIERTRRKRKKEGWRKKEREDRQ